MVLTWIDLNGYIRNRTGLQKQAILISVDLMMIVIAFGTTIALTHPWAVFAEIAVHWKSWSTYLFILVCLGASFSILLDLHRIKLKSYELQSVMRTAASAGLVGLFGALTSMFLDNPLVNMSDMFIFSMVLTIYSVGARIMMRHLTLESYLKAQTRKRVLIYGAGNTGVQLAAALKTDDSLEAVAFVDDNLTLQKMVVSNMPVYSPVRLEALISKKEIDMVILAMPSISRPKQSRIARKLEDMGCEVSMLPSFVSLISEGDRDLIKRVQPVDPIEYLNRTGLEHDIKNLCDIYGGRSVMVTGAGGSIGSELCRQILACRPKELVLFEIGEHALYQIERELRDLVGTTGVKIRSVLGSITDESTVRRVLSQYGVEIVLHAAAYKHVPMVERNMLVGVRNNVLGTKILADAARDAKVSHFILVSTDKAVRPTNVMGASKRLAELVIQDLATRADETRFGMVRFGNVLGSSGSVIPLFEEQISRGGPVTLTHSEISRFFMTIGEAARLVLMAGDYTQGGEVFVLDMGERIQIQKLARQMIERAGYSVRDARTPDGDIEIVITGLRPGEKLHEELLIGTETQPTGHPKILCAQEERLSEIEMATAIRALQTAVLEGNESRVKDVICRWVAGYVPQNELDEAQA